MKIYNNSILTNTYKKNTSFKALLKPRSPISNETLKLASLGITSASLAMIEISKSKKNNEHRYIEDNKEVKIENKSQKMDNLNDEEIHITAEMSNEEIIETLKNLKYPDGEARFDKYSISDISNAYSPEKSDVLNAMINAKYNNEPIFNKSDFYMLLKKTSPDNKDFLINLINAKNGNKYIFDNSDILNIFYNLTPLNNKALNRMIDANKEN